MFNLKWSALSAALGFVLSLLLSLASGARVFSLVRALIFGAGFFALSSLLYWMVKRFLPELLTSEDDGAPGLDMGSHVDISLDDDDGSFPGPALRMGTGGGAADDDLGGVPSGALGVEGLERLAADGGSPASGFDLPESGGSDGGEFPAGTALDQDRKTGYTGKDKGEKNSPADDFELFVPSSLGTVKSAGSGAAALPDGDIDALDVLPGPESMFRTFPSAFGDFGGSFAPKGEGGTPVSVAFPGVERNSIAPETGGGDFKGKEKESALAIQTILKRD